MLRQRYDLAIHFRPILHHEFRQFVELKLKADWLRSVPSIWTMIGQLRPVSIQTVIGQLDRRPVRQELVKVNRVAGGAEEGEGGVGWVQHQYAHASTPFEVRHISGEVAVA